MYTYTLHPTGIKLVLNFLCHSFLKAQQPVSTLCTLTSCRMVLIDINLGLDRLGAAEAHTLKHTRAWTKAMMSS